MDLSKLRVVLGSNGGLVFNMSLVWAVAFGLGAAAIAYGIGTLIGVSLAGQQ